VPGAAIKNTCVIVCRLLSLQLRLFTASSKGLTSQKQNKMFLPPLPDSYQILSQEILWHWEKNRIKGMSPFKYSVNGPGTELHPRRWGCLSYTRDAKPAGKAHVTKNMFIMAPLSSALICWKIQSQAGHYFSPFLPSLAFPQWNLELLVSTSPVNFFKAEDIVEQVLLCPREKSPSHLPWELLRIWCKSTCFHWHWIISVKKILIILSFW